MAVETPHARFQRWLETDPEEDESDEDDGTLIEPYESARLANLNRLIKNEAAKQSRRGGHAP